MGCKDCADKAQGVMVARAKRIEWTVETLKGMRPVCTESPEQIRANVDHTLYLAKERLKARGLDEDVWHTLGLVKKIELVESLIDWWPKKGVAP